MISGGVADESATAHARDLMERLAAPPKSRKGTKGNTRPPDPVG